MRGAYGRHKSEEGVACTDHMAVTTYTACDLWRMLYPSGNATDATNACNEVNLCLLQGMVVKESPLLCVVLCVGCQ